MTNQYPIPIHARLDPRVLDNLPKLFDATLITIFSELLQNARRAGARTVHVVLRADTHHVHIIDDGCGIPDPQLILSAGASGWHANTVTAETPAGLGIFSLSRCPTASIASRPQHPPPDQLPSWIVNLIPENYTGQQPAYATSTPHTPTPHGTEVTFAVDPNLASLQYIENAIKQAARHYPIPVYYNGDRLAQRPFIHHPLLTTTLRGVNIGIRRGTPLYGDPDLNFYGQTVRASLPSVAALDGPSYHALADIRSGADLELVLPARDKIVETPFLLLLRSAALHAIYQAIAQEDPAPRLAFKHHHAAAAHGLSLPIPKPMLHPWRPTPADIDRHHRESPLTTLPPNALIVPDDLEPPHAHTLYRAATLNDNATRLYEANPQLQGYHWYNRLPKITNIAFSATLDGQRHALTHDHDNGATLLPLDTFAPDTRPDTLAVHLHIASATGPDYTLDLPTDVLLTDSTDVWADNHFPLLSTKPEIAPADLADMLLDAYFYPSDDSDADSYTTQLRHYRNDAFNAVLRIMDSPEAATRAAIHRIIDDHLIWLVPSDSLLTINLLHRRADVRLTAPAPDSTAPHPAT